jgi:formylglycine-generating enzyme required for sulfatase activity
MTTPFERKDSNIEIESKTDNASTPINTEAKQDRQVAGEVFRNTLKDGFKVPDMVFNAGGRFEVGSDREMDSDTQGDEQPRHQVTIEAFYIGKYEVTFEEYKIFARGTKRDLPEDEGWGRGQRPVINVSWQDALAYTEWLSEQTGKRYRLPSEAEYAARAGTDTTYWWGDELRQDGKVRANCDGCGSQWDDKQTAPVGSFQPNAFGVYDTAGNVWEWAQDCWHDSYEGADRPDNGSAWEAAGGDDCARRVIRGGSWFDSPRGLRSAYRTGFYPDLRFNNLGFRLAQDIE